ncbi:uncharacterized protein TNCV_3070951 [Trichonephila clavipes]|nr:uncharacterized protein TNCV_3070951 [Trichonephila clavipes]
MVLYHERTNSGWDQVLGCRVRVRVPTTHKLNGCEKVPSKRFKACVRRLLHDLKFRRHALFAGCRFAKKAFYGNRLSMTKLQSEANPQVYVETPLHPEKLTVWCALWAGGIIGPYFFKNDDGHNVTVKSDRYRAMITIFFIPELNNHDVQELWFQQDGATCHTARDTIDLLKDTFDDRLILRLRPLNWLQDLVISHRWTIFCGAM